MPDDLVHKEYWDSVWAGRHSTDAIEPSGADLRNHLNREFDRLFCEVLSDTDTTDAPALEIGCARSRWLPYFARRFAFDVSGLDYSVAGCEQARAIARKSGVDARIVCADLFAPPEDMLDRYALVYSFGVVEHYEDTAGILRDLARFLRPGGIMVTIVPNLIGVTGALMRRFNRANYDQHVPLGRSALAAAHAQAGLELMQTRWVGSTNFAVVNLHGLRRRSPEWWLKRTLLNGLIACTVAIWALERLGVPVRRSRRWSPYVVCAARRPVADRTEDREAESSHAAQR